MNLKVKNEKSKIYFIIFFSISIIYSISGYAQTAAFTTQNRYRIQNSFGYADFGTSDLATMGYIDLFTGTFTYYTTTTFGPLPFYQIQTNKFGYAFDKNVISNVFTSSSNQLNFGFVSNTATPIVSTAMIIAKTNGKVGIGYTTPINISAKLGVTTDVNISGFEVHTNHTADWVANTWLTVNRDACQALKISNNNYNATGTYNDVFRVMGTGYTQIGTKGANGSIWSGVMLSVYGKVLARSVHVSIDPAMWADYVFEKDYKLKPLVEVENYYKQHKHLPEIPSAQEIGEKGSDLAQTDILLLKKIEELTLYMVEQQKEIELLKTELKELKK